MRNTLLQLGTKAAIAASLLAPFAAMGQGAPQLPTTNITSASRALGFLCDIAGWMFAFLVVLAIVFILVAAFRYLTAQGNEEKVGEANQALIYAAVAIAVGVVAKAIPLIVSTFLGASGNIPNC